jgi:hypothetical protein
VAMIMIGIAVAIGSLFFSFSLFFFVFLDLEMDLEEACRYIIRFTVLVEIMVVARGFMFFVLILLITNSLPMKFIVGGMPAMFIEISSFSSFDGLFSWLLVFCVFDDDLIIGIILVM